MNLPNDTEIFQKSASIEKTILVIDDDDSLLFLNKAVLESDGYKVFTAKGGNEALTILANIPNPNLILLDMRMEGMSGPEFLLALEEKYPEIIKTVPIVFLTAMDKVPVTKASGFIKKPMDLDHFLTDIGRFIETRVEVQNHS